MAEPNTIPIGIGGAFALLLMALVPFAPRIYEALVIILKNIGTRMSARNDEQLKALDAFQILQSEVIHLRDERGKFEARLFAAEEKAEKAEQRADEVSRSLERMQVQINTLQRELDRAQGANAEKDKRIIELENKIIILIQENSDLRRELADYKGK